MSKYKFVNPQNVDALVPVSVKAMRVLDEGLSAWDKESGIPSRIVAHNATHGAAWPAETGVDLGAYVVGLGADNGAVFLTVQPDGAEPEEGRSKQPALVIEPTNTVNGAATRFELALRYILKGFSYAGGHTVYQHAILTRSGEELLYYGITKRGWATRWGEHWSDAKSGSNLMFHKALREELLPGAKICHTICVAGVNEESAFEAEEYLVAKRSLYPDHPNGLNMIPGGKAGILWLHKLGALKDRASSAEGRDAALRKWVDENPRKGLPNPLISEAWARQEYAEAVICGAPGRLSRAQVVAIRECPTGMPPSDIAQLVGASNARQVDRVVRGVTYARVGV